MPTLPTDLVNSARSPSTSTPSLPPLSALILAGGEGRRMGGRDKGLVVYQQKPLIQWVLDALPEQVIQRVISCNRNLDIYSQYGQTITDDPCFASADQPFAGAMVGIVAGLKVCTQDWVIVTPCDLIYYPRDFAAKAWAALTQHLALHPEVAKIAVAHDGERRQNLCLLLHRDEAAGIVSAMTTSHAVHAWLDARGALSISWPEPHAFTNVNDLATLAHLAP